MATPTEQKKQVLSHLSKSASLANVRTDVTTPVPSPKNGPIQGSAASQGLQVTFFFDGTGNNLTADFDTREHSNVARLFRSHRDDAAQGILRYYIPGIGTYFKDIGDPGNTALGGGAGDMGEARLKWAMQRMDKCLASSDGRKTIHLALFGFSRGATLARAFALRIAKRCQRTDDGWRITLGQRAHPIRLYFMGLFDTVASVGVPTSANNAGALAGGLGSTRLTLWDRGGSDLMNLAFGNGPGADPARGVANGHMAWADDLHIPDMVEDCLHMVAAHDNQLLSDVRALQSLVYYGGRERLRPHYQKMLEAYEAEQRGQGLRDRSIIEFFDTYVHDSLAAFAKDATLPSDPRVIYIGGDKKLPYAVNLPRGQGAPASALG